VPPQSIIHSQIPDSFWEEFVTPEGIRARCQMEYDESLREMNPADLAEMNPIDHEEALEEGYMTMFDDEYDSAIQGMREARVRPKENYPVFIEQFYFAVPMEVHAVPMWLDSSPPKRVNGVLVDAVNRRGHIQHWHLRMFFEKRLWQFEYVSVWALDIATDETVCLCKSATYEDLQAQALKVFSVKGGFKEADIVQLHLPAPVYKTDQEMSARIPVLIMAHRYPEVADEIESLLCDERVTSAGVLGFSQVARLVADVLYHQPLSDAWMVGEVFDVDLDLTLEDVEGREESDINRLMAEREPAPGSVKNTA
jgi:hypothetical protein